MICDNVEHTSTRLAKLHAMKVDFQNLQVGCNIFPRIPIGPSLIVAIENDHVMHFTRINTSATTAGDKLRGTLVPEILMANMVHNLDVR